MTGSDGINAASPLRSFLTAASAAARDAALGEDGTSVCLALGEVGIAGTSLSRRREKMLESFLRPLRERIVSLIEGLCNAPAAVSPGGDAGTMN